MSLVGNTNEIGLNPRGMLYTLRDRAIIGSLTSLVLLGTIYSLGERYDANKHKILFPECQKSYSFLEKNLFSPNYVLPEKINNFLYNNKTLDN